MGPDHRPREKKSTLNSSTSDRRPPSDPLVDFLRARLTDDEATVRDLATGAPDVTLAGVALGPDRLLAEVASKRKILALCHWLDGYTGPGADALKDTPGRLTLRNLALAYRDHPDYDPAWTV